MSTVATPVPPQAIQTEPTPAGQPQPVPVQPRDDQGRFAPQAVQPPTPQPSTAPVAPPAPDAPYSVVDIGNGQVEVRFKDLPEIYRGTQAEILPKVADALYNTKKWAQSQRQPAPQPVQPPAPTSPWVNPEEKAAAEQLLDLTAKSLGYKSGEELRQRLNFIDSTTEEVGSRDLAVQFMSSQPDYNPTQQNSQIIAQVLDGWGLEGMWDQLPSAKQLELMRGAHAYAIQNKLYTPATPQAAAPVATPSGPVPPPIPTQSAPRDEFSGVPKELIPTVNDSQTVILQKIGKLKEMGLWQ